MSMTESKGSLSSSSLDSSAIDHLFSIGKSSRQSTQSLPMSKRKSQKVAEKEKIRFDQFDGQFLGFVGGFGNKPIEIGKSKLKKARQIFDFSSSPKRTQTISQFQLQLSVENFPNNEQFPQFSLGFTNLSTGARIDIPKEKHQKAKQFMKLSSKKKSTKVKATDVERIEVYQKTAVDKKNKKSKIQPDYRREKQLLKSLSKYRQKRKTKNIKLCDLESPKKIVQKFDLSKDLSHQSNSCSVPLCYFCRNYPEKNLIIDNYFLIKQLKKLIKVPLLQERISELIQVQKFKLYRYNFCYSHTILNKQFNANNLLTQMFNKLKQLEKQNCGYLQFVLRSIGRGNNGKSINLVVMDIRLNEEIQSYFIKLTDGWSIVFAVINEQNMLFPFIRKLSPGTKLNIVDWKIYPICNIIDYHPDQPNSQTSTCIEFEYNCSRFLPHNSKLGRPHTLFYRPLQKCKQKGGYVPVIEGTILRMANRKHITGNSQKGFVQILTVEGKSYIMSVYLPGEMSIVEMFRLYYTFQLYRVRKVNSLELEFSSTGRFAEIVDAKRQERVIELLRKRLINCSKEVLSEELADLITQSSNIRVNGKNIIVEENINGLTLLQQYKLTNLDGVYTLSRTEHSTCLRKLPKLYEQISYKLF